MSYQPARIFVPAEDGELVAQMAQIHHDCITKDFMLATFLPPLSMPEILAFWQNYATESRSSTRKIFLQTFKHDQGEEEVVGVVSLHMPRTQTGPFRSEVNKLVVSPNHRFKGIARNLMSKLEAYAKVQNRGLIQLSTTFGNGADLVYPKLGYIALGTIPNYGISPRDGKLKDEIFFYKDVRDPAE